MTIAPFGVLHEGYKASLKNGPGQDGVFEPMQDWVCGKQAFKRLMATWLADVTATIWPSWQDGAWAGDSASDMKDATKAELELAVQLYHGAGGKPDILTEAPNHLKPAPPLITHRWHYKIEDALVLDPQFLYLELSAGVEPSFVYRASNNIGSNFLAYDPSVDITDFEDTFWGRMKNIQPSIWDVKQHFQRPRPWTTATLLNVENFRWIVAGGNFITHTGVHPSLLSGHCIQGILGGCTVLEGLLDSGEPIDSARIRAVQQYMVDWGDRRVFAGVHYMTDNIASWTLARRLIPHLFRHPQKVEDLAVQAVTRQSRVFSDIVQHFDPDSPARTMLLDYFPEAVPSS